jgi:GntR family transcriptional regulator
MKLEIDHSSGIPLHVQVEGLLRELVKEKKYIDGNPLPKEVDLSKILGIARNTIRQATNKLVFEGILTRKKGVGTFVAQKNVSTRLDNWSSFTEEMNQLGIKFKNYKIESEFVSADSDLADNLKIKEGKDVLMLKRLRGDEDGPFVYFISYFHPRLGLNGEEDFTMPLYELLERDYATRAMTSREEIRAIVADEELSNLLKVEPDSPILFRKRHVLDPGGRIIEYNLCYYRSDKFAYTIDIKRNA